MAVTFASEDALFDAVMAFFRAQFSSQDLSDKGFLGLLARAQAQALALHQRASEQVDFDSVPAFKQDADGTVLSRCSSAALDNWGITYGLPSGTSGIYGRKAATGSSGGAGVPTCSVAATVIPANSTATDPTGLITVKTTAAVTTDGPPNTQSASFVSVTTGEQANLPVGTVLTWTAPPPNVGATVALTSALTGGADRESDGDLLTRILFRLQNPPRGGTAADYRYWVESAVDLSANLATLSLFRGYVYPQRSGVGSVDVIGLLRGSGTARLPSSAVRTALLAYLNSVRPVTAIVNVLSPTQVAIRIRVRVDAPAKYAYDWDDLDTSTTIQGGTTSTVIVNNADFPANLRTAVDSGARPRVQLALTTSGASATPYVRQVTAYAVAGTTTLTLGSALPVAPTAGDLLWAGGPVVDTVAARILAYIDSLGPSRASGLADIYDAWEADVKLARVADVVMETRDGDGARMVLDIPDLATTGILIKPGTGAYAAQSYTTRDTGTPELAYVPAGGIEVVRG